MPFDALGRTRATMVLATSIHNVLFLGKRDSFSSQEERGFFFLGGYWSFLHFFGGVKDFSVSGALPEQKCFGESE